MSGQRLPSLAFLVVALAVAGCRDAPPKVDGTAPFVSGERLRAQLQDGGSGAEQFIAWWDSALEVSCQFLRADDDKLRCLPGGRYPGSPSFTLGLGNLVYIDADCTMKAHAAGLAGEDPQPYVVGEIFDNGGCGDTKFAIHELGEPIPNVTSYYYKSAATGECSGGSPAGTYTFHSIGKHVEPSRFVAATQVRSKRSAELEALVLAADDGASQIIGAVDRKRSRPCWLGPFGQDDGSCLPRTLGFVTRYYADATCSQALAYSSDFVSGSSICEATTVGLSYRYDDGVPSFEYFEIGDELPKESIFVSTAEGCEANPDPESDDHRYFSLGESIPESAFPTMTSARIGLGPVSAVHVADADGIPLQASHFVDRQSDARCSVKVTCDGLQRCIPNYAIPVYRTNLYFYYADSSCSVPLAWHGCSFLDVSDAIIDFPAADSCHADATIGSLYEVGPAYEGALYHYDESGACAEQEPEDGTCYYQLGAAIDLERFAPIVDRIE